MNILESLRKPAAPAAAAVAVPPAPKEAARRAAPRVRKDNPLLADVDRQIEEGYFRNHDRANPLHRKAFDLHVEAHRRALRAKRRGNRVCAIESPSAVKSVIEHRILDICDNLAILERKAALARLEESEKHVIAELGIHQACFLGDDESIDVHRLEVVKKDKAEEVGELKSLVQFCQKLSSDEASVPLESVCNGAALPAELQARSDFKAFLSDLGLFLVNEGDNGRKLIQRVCAEHAFAQRVLGDDDQPRPVRFLASISLKVQSFSAPKSRQGQVVGFKAN